MLMAQFGQERPVVEGDSAGRVAQVSGRSTSLTLRLALDPKPPIVRHARRSGWSPNLTLCCGAASFRGCK